jgi:hypothetical protein
LNSFKTRFQSASRKFRAYYSIEATPRIELG